MLNHYLRLSEVVSTDTDNLVGCPKKKGSPDDDVVFVLVEKGCSLYSRF